jgi:serine/threonine-protein kinase
MAITDTLVLPAHMLVVPVKDLSEEVRRQVKTEDGDFAITRPHSRTPSRIVDADAAELIQEFREPTTVVQAVIRFSKARRADPEQLLEEAFPMIERLVQARLLVEADSAEAQKIRPFFDPGATFAGTEILSCIQALEDTDLYKVKTADGEIAALKLLRPRAGAEVGRMFDREAFVLERLDGIVSPRLFKSGVEDERRYLLVEWCSGVDCASAAAELRQLGGREDLQKMCRAILVAYARLHSKNVIHSDIHPRNVLLAGNQAVKIIDFGLARVAGIENEFRRARRGGVGFFFEPEYVRAVRANHRPPQTTAPGEQYALAALLYFLVTGKHYLDFSLEKDEMFRQIAEDGPAAFSDRGVESWPELEKVLVKALSKLPSDRFESVGEFAEQLGVVTVPVASAQYAPSETTPASYGDAEEMLKGMLARLDAAGPLFASGLKTAPKVSVTYGTAGIAYGLYRIACAREDAKLLSLADLWATRAARDGGSADAFYAEEIQITPEVVGRISPYHTASGIHVVQTLIAHAMCDVVGQQAALEGFMRAVMGAGCDNLDVTLGQSGVLLSASLLAETLSGNSLVEVSPLLAFGNRLFNRIWAEIDGYPPIRECRQIRYSGAAHGWAGILYAMLCWHRAAGAALPVGFEERLAQLAGLAQHVGRAARWKWTIGGHHHQDEAGAYVAGWCNGSAGFIHLWTLAHQILKDERYLRLAEKAAWHAWQSEAQIGNLCCGFAGQAYALLNLYKHAGEKAWLHRAQAQARRAARAIREMPPGSGNDPLILRAESLYKGELGVAILAAELAQPEFAAMPFFERAI